MGNLTKEYYTGLLEYFRPDYRQRIINNEFPIILVKDGNFIKEWITEEQISNYSHFHALDEDFKSQSSNEFFGWPIVHNDAMNDAGLPQKEIDGRSQDSFVPYPDWSNWIP